jgi:hypothetical protein
MRMIDPRDERRESQENHKAEESGTLVLINRIFDFDRDSRRTSAGAARGEIVDALPKSRLLAVARLAWPSPGSSDSEDATAGLCGVE